VGRFFVPAYLVEGASDNVAKARCLTAFQAGALVVSAVLAYRFAVLKTPIRTPLQGLEILTMPVGIWAVSGHRNFSLERISKPKSAANITFGVRVTNITSLLGGRTQ
jgi:hypothetical protein